MSSSQNTRKRPLSPHLTIYKPQITSMLSISHRLSGVALFAGALLFSWWIIANIYGCADCINPLIYSVVGKAFIAIWTLLLYYHLCNGVRHLFWDIGKGFEINTARKTGWLVVFSSVILTTATWYCVLVN